MFNDINIIIIETIKYRNIKYNHNQNQNHNQNHNKTHNKFNSFSSVATIPASHYYHKKI